MPRLAMIARHLAGQFAVRVSRVSSAAPGTQGTGVGSVWLGLDFHTLQWDCPTHHKLQHHLHPNLHSRVWIACACLP
jgi:hypothetical protein